MGCCPTTKHLCTNFSSIYRPRRANLTAQDVGELSLCRIVLDLGVAGDGVTTDKPADGGEELDMRSQASHELADALRTVLIDPPAVVVHVRQGTTPHLR